MPVHDHAGLVRQLIPALLDAGAFVLRCRAEGVDPETKGDGSPVSRADRGAEAILVAALARVAPHVPVIAEEAVAAGQIPAFDAAAFLVDALDGTKEFLSGGADFTVNIGLVEDGVPVLGMVLAPASGRLFVTLGPGEAAGAHIPPERIGAGFAPLLERIATAEPDIAALRVVSSRSSRSKETEAFLGRFAVGRDERMGSSVKFGIIAAGEADLYPRFGPTSAWDIAAGHAVLAAAGGAVTRVDGTPLTYLDQSRLGEREPFLNPPFIAWGRPSLIPAGLARET
jgi:3'(2'), 5'-bisphosphate nucleotidase